ARKDRLAPVLDLPAALLGEAAQLAVRIYGDRLVGPFERGLVGHVIGIKANVAVRTPEARFPHPIGDHPKLRRAIAILAQNLRVHAFVEANDRAGSDHVVKAEAIGDCVRIEAVRCGREDEAPSLRFVARDRLARAGPDVRRQLLFGEAIDQRLEIARVDLRAEQEGVVDLLQSRAVDQPRNISEHRQQDQRQEQQAPRRAAQRAMQEERSVGGPARHRPVHVVNRKIAHLRPARMSSARAWSSGLSTSIPATALLSTTAVTSRPSLPPTRDRTFLMLSKRSAVPINTIGPSSEIRRQPFLRSCSTDRHSSIAAAAFGEFSAKRLAPVYAPPRNFSQVLFAPGKRFSRVSRSTTPTERSPSA